MAPCGPPAKNCHIGTQHSGTWNRPETKIDTAMSSSALGVVDDVKKDEGHRAYVAVDEVGRPRV
jgi:hypothetical protein